MREEPIHYLLTGDTFSILANGTSHQTTRSNPNWEKIKDAIADENVEVDEIIELMNYEAAVAQVLQESIEDTVFSGKVRIEDGKVFFGDEEVHTTLAQRMLDVLGEGLPIARWIKFAEKVYANPSIYTREELYQWLEGAKMPITEDGNFLAYKMVNADYMDQHSRSFENKVGNIISMPREKVDPNRRNHCSQGLHFCSRGYVGAGGGQTRLMLVEINPADVVAIPDDYSYTKGRTWRYKVVGEIPIGTVAVQTWKSTITDAEIPQNAPALVEEHVAPEEQVENASDGALFKVFSAESKKARDLGTQIIAMADKGTLTARDQRIGEYRKSLAKAREAADQIKGTPGHSGSLSVQDALHVKEQRKALRYLDRKVRLRTDKFGVVVPIKDGKVERADGTVQGTEKAKRVKGRKRNYPVVHTEGHGEITLSKLNRFKKINGTWKAVAETLEVSDGVLRGWLKRLKEGK